MAIGLLVPASLLWNAGIMSSGLVIGVALLLLAYAARLMAAALEPIEAGLERIAPSTRHASRMLGRGPVGGAIAVDLPLARGAVLTAALLVFIDIVKELPATLILRPFNFDTLAVIANNYALDERLGQAGLPSLIVVALALGPVIWLSRRIAAVRPAS
jgi:iron(III) transport system permease protein